MKKTLAAIVVAAAILTCGAAVAQQTPPKAPPKPENGKIVGTWALDIDAGGMIINLTMVITEAEGKLSGKVSEQNGMFTDADLNNIEYNGEDFVGEISVSSPPDGSVKTWSIKTKVGEETLEGTIENADAGMSAGIAGKRVKK
jgi:hypothetical protein